MAASTRSSSGRTWSRCCQIWHWPIDRYFDEGRREVDWLGRPTVAREHRTLSGYVNALLDAGPDAQAIARPPRLGDQCRRPPFLVVRADKPA